MKLKLCPILQSVKDEIRGQISTKQATTRQMNAFNKLVQKIADGVGGSPTDSDLRRLGHKDLLSLTATDDEKDIVKRITRSLFSSKQKLH